MQEEDRPLLMLLVVHPLQLMLKMNKVLPLPVVVQPVAEVEDLEDN